MIHIELRRSEIVVGLGAPPPDYPARVAARLTAELAGQLAQRVDADVRWTVPEGWSEVAPRRDCGVEALLDDLARRRADALWDVAICLTDLPLHGERVPLVAQASARRRVAMVSVPTLGLRQLRAVRAAVPISWAGYSPTLPTSGCRRPAGHRPSWQAGFPRFAGWSARLRPGNWATLPRGGSAACGCWPEWSGPTARDAPLLGLSKLLVGAFARPRSRSPRTPSGRWAMRSADS